ncbi:MAG: small acid-soluble spore protein SspI [Mycoplasmatota bacterium]|nr:small acid-soluble spore protein SspI [Mycoplasmatota bacterium]
MSIREHIINNFKGDDFAALKAAIDESIESKDEITLPGLGVFFELAWESADQELKNTLIELIKQNIQKGPTI